ncbi:ohanin-like [Rhineura floridana]|uniref:ohanin-like n=1 Tax=Rhineura floridana TaxID=261503 RepID=UPI002AC8676E|nr:ohanin-like [Rhineura floridana]
MSCYYFTATLDEKEEVLAAMSLSDSSHLSFQKTSNVQLKFKGLYCILWLSLCVLAEFGGKVLASSPEKRYKADVTFDPDTAHPALVVSENRKKVKSEGVDQDVPDSPERFSKSPCLLGSLGFTSGKHYWEVKYGKQREWACGVARKSVERKKPLRLIPEEGIVQEGLWWLRRVESDAPTLPKDSGKIGILLDYERNTVIFYIGNKIIKKSIPFNGEEVLPFCYVGGGVSLRLIP